ncbi:putative serine/threonine-protein kinase nek3 [Diplonema papillatum]|nr:putative serine/threonine-protein kinase nek3 [Diplonema papillatum]
MSDCPIVASWTRYKKVQTIGAGSYGQVYLVEGVKDKVGQPGTHVVKRVHVTDLTDDELKAAINEVQVLSLLDHCNVVAYRDHFVDGDGFLNIVMEHCSQGDLAKFIDRRKEKGGPFKQSELCFLAFQLLQGLKYIHSIDIIHRDLKPANLFLTKDGTLKIADFGISKLVSATTAATSIVGTPFYFSPEICENKPYTNKADIWGAGCVLYELACFEKPFCGNNILAVVKKITDGHYKPLPRRYTKLARMVNNMLQVDPSKRLSVPGLIEEFYTGVGASLQAPPVDGLTLHAMESIYSDWAANLGTFAAPSDGKKKRSNSNQRQGSDRPSVLPSSIAPPGHHGNAVQQPFSEDVDTSVPESAARRSRTNSRQPRNNNKDGHGSEPRDRSQRRKDSGSGSHSEHSEGGNITRKQTNGVEAEHPPAHPPHTDNPKRAPQTDKSNPTTRRGKPSPSLRSLSTGSNRNAGHQDPAGRPNPQHGDAFATKGRFGNRAPGASKASAPPAVETKQEPSNGRGKARDPVQHHPVDCSCAVCDDLSGGKMRVATPPIQLANNGARVRRTSARVAKSATGLGIASGLGSAIAQTDSSANDPSNIASKTSTMAKAQHQKAHTGPGMKPKDPPGGRVSNFGQQRSAVKHRPTEAFMPEVEFHLLPSQKCLLVDDSDAASADSSISNASVYSKNQNSVKRSALIRFRQPDGLDPDLQPPWDARCGDVSQAENGFEINKFRYTNQQGHIDSPGSPGSPGSLVNVVPLDSASYTTSNISNSKGLKSALRVDTSPLAESSAEQLPLKANKTSPTENSVRSSPFTSPVRSSRRHASFLLAAGAAKQPDEPATTDRNLCRSKTGEHVTRELEDKPGHKKSRTRSTSSPVSSPTSRHSVGLRRTSLRMEPAVSKESLGNGADETKSPSTRLKPVGRHASLLLLHRSMEHPITKSPALNNFRTTVESPSERQHHLVSSEDMDEDLDINSPANTPKSDYRVETNIAPESSKTTKHEPDTRLTTLRQHRTLALLSPPSTFGRPQNEGKGHSKHAIDGDSTPKHTRTDPPFPTSPDALGPTLPLQSQPRSPIRVSGVRSSGSSLPSTEESVMHESPLSKPAGSPKARKMRAQRAVAEAAVFAELDTDDPYSEESFEAYDEPVRKRRKPRISDAEWVKIRRAIEIDASTSCKAELVNRKKKSVVPASDA